MDEMKKDLETLIRKYKTNKEKVSPEDLKTRYKGAFDKLRNEIHDLAGEYLWQVIFGDLESTFVTGECYDKIEEYIKIHNINRKAGTCAYSEYSVDNLDRLAKECKKDIMKIINDFGGLKDNET